MALTLNVNVKTKEVRPGGRVGVEYIVTSSYPEKVTFKIDWYLNGKKISTMSDRVIGPGGTYIQGISITAPSWQGTYTLTAKLYRLTPDGQWVFEVQDSDTFKVIGEPEEPQVVSEDSTVQISGYTATIYGRVTIKSPVSTTIYPAIEYYGGKIFLDPITIKAGTLVYQYVRTFDFRSVYEFLKSNNLPTDAYISYFKSDKRTRLKGDYTAFKLEPKGVVTPKAVVELVVDKSYVQRGESISGTATIEKVEGIKLPTTASILLHGDAYDANNNKFSFSFYLFSNKTISTLPVSARFSFNPTNTNVEVLRNAVKIILYAKATIGGYEFKSNTVTVTIIEPKVTSWSVKADKTTVKPGDTLTIQATVNWVGKSMKFKLGIDAFGKHYESEEVTATASPTIIKVPITVPAVKEGTYEIKVTLYYE